MVKMLKLHFALKIGSSALLVKSNRLPSQYLAEFSHVSDSANGAVAIV